MQGKEKEELQKSRSLSCSEDKLANLFFENLAGKLANLLGHTALYKLLYSTMLWPPRPFCQLLELRSQAKIAGNIVLHVRALPMIEQRRLQGEMKLTPRCSLQPQQVLRGVD